MTTTMRERFDKKFTYASFTWNGDNATGVKFAKNTKKKMLDFIEQELKKEREEIVEMIEEKDWECFEQTFIKKDIINTIKNRA